MEVDKIMRTLLTLGANSNTPRRHGSGKNNETITNTRGSPLPCLRGVLEFAPSISNVLIILSTSMSSWSARVYPIMRTLLTLGANSSTPRRHGSGQHNGNITNTRGKLEHSTKTWKWTLPCLRGVLEFAPSVSNVLIILSTSMSSWSARVGPYC
jgi:hypothetical protein